MVLVVVLRAMETPVLVIAGDAEVSPHLTLRGADWHADLYRLSPGRESLLTLFGGEHGLGGIAGYDAAETTDENPARVALVQQLSWAYLRSVLYPNDQAWPMACAALKDSPEPPSKARRPSDGRCRRRRAPVE